MGCSGDGTVTADGGSTGDGNSADAAGNVPGVASARVLVTLNAGPAPSLVAAGDFDGDKITDLVVANNPEGAMSGISILKGVGGGQFAAPVFYPVGPIKMCDSGGTIATFCGAKKVARLQRCDDTFFTPDIDYQSYHLCSCAGGQQGTCCQGVSWKAVECCN